MCVRGLYNLPTTLLFAHFGPFLCVSCLYLYPPIIRHFFIERRPRDDRHMTERRNTKNSTKNGNYCDCNRKNAIKFGGFKKKLYLCSANQESYGYERNSKESCRSTAIAQFVKKNHGYSRSSSSRQNDSVTPTDR